MTNRASNRKPVRKKLSPSAYTRNYFSAIGKKLKNNSLFRLLNKEEDEDNDQTFWPFTSTGRLKLSRLN